MAVNKNNHDAFLLNDHILLMKRMRLSFYMITEVLEHHKYNQLSISGRDA